MHRRPKISSSQKKSNKINSTEDYQKFKTHVNLCGSYPLYSLELCHEFVNRIYFAKNKKSHNKCLNFTFAHGYGCLTEERMFRPDLREFFFRSRVEGTKKKK